MEDRLGHIIDVLVHIDDPAAGAELARRAHLSRFHFARVSAAIPASRPARSAAACCSSAPPTS